MLGFERPGGLSDLKDRTQQPEDALGTGTAPAPAGNRGLGTTACSHSGWLCAPSGLRRPSETKRKGGGSFKLPQGGGGLCSGSGWRWFVVYLGRVVEPKDQLPGL